MPRGGRSRRSRHLPQSRRELLAYGAGRRLALSGDEAVGTLAHHRLDLGSHLSAEERWALEELGEESWWLWWWRGWSRAQEERGDRGT